VGREAFFKMLTDSLAIKENTEEAQVVDGWYALTKVTV
jgi:hypothetical protein